MAVINIPRLMLAAPASGSGKTTVTCALLGTGSRNRHVLFSHVCKRTAGFKLGKPKVKAGDLQYGKLVA